MSCMVVVPGEARLTMLCLIDLGVGRRRTDLRYLVRVFRNQRVRASLYKQFLHVHEGATARRTTIVRPNKMAQTHTPTETANTC